MVNNNKTLKTISEKQMQQRGKIRESVKKKNIQEDLTGHRNTRPTGEPDY